MKKLTVVAAGAVALLLGSAGVYAGGAGCLYGQDGEIAKLAPQTDLLADDVLATELSEAELALLLKQREESARTQPITVHN